MKKPWFEISREGLSQLQGPRPKTDILRELVQNCLDEDITECIVELKKKGHYVEILVKDDSPKGFQNLAHAYTLFDFTYKRADVTKRGRYNLGEKLALAHCREGSIKTTKGTIRFDKDGTRTESRARGAKTDKGTEVRLIVKMTQTEYKSFLEMAHNFLPPENIRFLINGEIISYRVPLMRHSICLMTEVFKEEKNKMTATFRHTAVHLHLPKDGEVGTVFEMGIPIQETGDKYHADIQQKVPMTMDRNAVMPSFLRDLRVEILNRIVDKIEPEEISAEWVRDATRDSSVHDEVLCKVADKRWGKDRFVADPTDSRSVDEARAHGYTQVHGSTMDKREWEQFRRVNAVPLSSQKFPTTYVGEEEILEKDWTEAMKIIADYARMIAERTMDKELTVKIIQSSGDNSASYGNNRITFNHTRLGAAWWAGGICESTTDLILHELAHEGGNHTEHGYHKMLTKIAARLVVLALKKSWLFSEIA